MIRSRAAQRPLWLITRHENNRMIVLTINRGSGEKTLPIFSFREEAETFLWFGVVGRNWRARETMAGELLSILCGPYSGVKKVALDPLPVVIDGLMLDLVSLGRESFVRSLLGARGPSTLQKNLSWAEVSTDFDPSESSDERGIDIREDGRQHERRKNIAARRSVKRITSAEKLCEADDLAVPDYILWDFGFPEGPPNDPGTQRHSLEVLDVNEEFAPGCE